MTWNGDCKIEGCERECVDASRYCKKHKKAMSNQPKPTDQEEQENIDLGRVPPDLGCTQPKPTGEWTVSTIDEWIRLNPSTWRSVIAFEHKAALDAKDELHAAALQVLERHHRKQLAAEREKVTLATQMVQIEIPDGNFVNSST